MSLLATGVRHRGTGTRGAANSNTPEEQKKLTGAFTEIGREYK